jgi:hypothetical protein
VQALIFAIPQKCCYGSFMPAKIRYDIREIPVDPVEPLLRSHLIMLADQFCKATGYKRSSVALYAQGGAGFIDGLVGAHKQKGHAKRRSGFTVRTYDDVVAWFGTRWPAGVQFPTLDDAAQSLKKEGSPNGKARTKQARATG